MAVKSGAGASVSSGAAYQARVGAYIFAAVICDAANNLISPSQVISVGFETAEDVDDILISLNKNASVYLQAKAKIAFSIKTDDGDLRSVFEQFARQHNARPKSEDDRFGLITSARSSKKVTFDLRAALEAYRLGDSKSFSRDQPSDLIEIINCVRGVIRGSVPDDAAAEAVLKKSFVQILDLEDDEPLVQGTQLLLQSRKFAMTSALWSKMVADCVTHSKSRHTVTVDNIFSIYSKFQLDEAAFATPVQRVIKFDLTELQIAAGREIVLARPADLIKTAEAFDAKFGESKMPIIFFEFYRFDESCNERLRFEDGTLILQNGLVFNVIRRTSSVSGMIRFIDASPGLFSESSELVLMGINSDENFDTSPCALAHRAKVQQILERRENLLSCVRCGASISQNDCSLIEFQEGAATIAGLVHPNCLNSCDRVLGRIYSELFDKNKNLLNFDYEGWYRACEGGQIVFLNASQISYSEKVIAWGGVKPKGRKLQYVVECALKDGRKEIVTVRNGVHRFTKAEAHAFADQLNTMVAKEIDDPLSYTDESKAFGPKSRLLEYFGAREQIVPIKKVAATKYEEGYSRKYSRPGHWYAPLMYLSDRESGLIVGICGSIPLISDPLNFDRFLSNWKEAGITIEDFETHCILTDEAFDEFMASLEADSILAIVDPLFGLQDFRLLSGFPVVPISAVKDFTSQ